MTERLTLKWGTVKGWDNLSDASLDAFQKWAEGGVSAHGAMFQRDTAEQKSALCELIDTIAANGGEIWSDWDGRALTADEAKTYVTDYRI